ncbi:MAG TPA: phosphatidylserine/phosphatidylglycerophosphate/cardiolipin synthase family protein [Pirellulales bacterium]|nr:phosphatidylserine/phosphatidylglycerophosphate/cardiolipin synthase family protein [Pirellulales bacterium]
MARGAAWIFGLLLIGATAPVRADSFRLLHSNYEALQARADLIQQARHQIDASYYWIDDDQVGALFLSLLREAALRGVRVRLLVDAAHNDIPPQVQRCLVASGVQIREYHPHHRGHPLWLNRRMHDKTLITDATHLIVGSRNIRNCHFGLARINYVDRDAYLQGQTALEAQRYFDCAWHSDQVSPTEFETSLAQRLRQRRPDAADASQEQTFSRRGDGRTGPMPSPCCCELWLAAGQGLSVCGQPIELDRPRDWSADAAETGCAWFVYDPRGLKGQPRGISEQMLRLIDRARGSIALETPYFVMSAAFKRALAAAVGRGVRVTVLTNSLASTDHMLVAATFTNQKHWLLSHGVQIFELAGPDHLHAKTAVIDCQIAFVGSYNFDPRSEYLNTETGVIVDDPGVAALVGESVGDHLRRAYRIGPDGREPATGQRQPGATPGQVLKMEALRILAPLLRRSL